ncbi:MAG TPA: thioredoxin domain-containing protein, partial [Ktedonobacteraceae bacterium]|nr:thioredoxin domain-containing protein [Ktedonobacteraceae bacterium]
AAWAGEEGYFQRADTYLRSLADVITKHPQAFGHLLGSLDFALSSAREIAVAGASEQPETQTLLAVINGRYQPNSVLACASPSDQDAISTVPLLADRPLKNGQPCVYICRHFTCLAPVTTSEELAELLRQ